MVTWVVLINIIISRIQIWKNKFWTTAFPLRSCIFLHVIEPNLFFSLPLIFRRFTSSAIFIFQLHRLELSINFLFTYACRATCFDACLEIMASLAFVTVAPENWQLQIPIRNGNCESGFSALVYHVHTTSMQWNRKLALAILTSSAFPAPPLIEFKQ